MREDFLYHVWKYRKFDAESATTSEGELLKILHPGFQNENSGPDFFNAKIQIGEQLWAGNVEMHLKSSHWYVHEHQNDSQYDNVILHVVWEHDVDIFRKDNSVVPTLILKDKVEEAVLQAYNNLLFREHLKLNCENDFKSFSNFQVEHWLERLYFERLESRSGLIHELLAKTGNDWEAVLFTLLSRSFGSKVNADAFMNIAQSFDFKLIHRLGHNQISLEALLLGQAKLLNSTDKYGSELTREYEFLVNKYSLTNDHLSTPQFFRLRPDNFPGLRLAQLAALYSNKKHLFLDVIKADNLEDLRSLFKLEIPNYWKSHYHFNKEHAPRNKNLTSSFIDILLINCVIPIKQSYARFGGQEKEDLIQELITGITAEKNAIIGMFNKLRPNTAINALHSQALLQLKTNYCDANRCLQCELGASLLSKSHKYI